MANGSGLVAAARGRVIRFLRWLLPSHLREALLYAVLAASVAYVVHALFIDTRVWNRLDSRILTDTVVAGGNFQIEYDVEWSSSCEVTGFRFIIDGEGYQHERVRDFRMVEEGPEHFVISVPVPRSAAPGVASYTGTIQYVCNSMQRFFAPMERRLYPRTFTILPAPEASLSTRTAMQCPAERPVLVSQHCRSLPGQHPAPTRVIQLSEW